MSRALLALLAASLVVDVAAVDRLTVVNACPREPIWIAHLANVGVGPGPQNVKIMPSASFSFTDTMTDGLAGSRYWPKMGCDPQGNNCALGGSGGPTQSCVKNGGDYSHCAPPVDTKFEATWGRAGQPCNAAVPSEMAGCDSVDMSLVDGWTLPFKLEVLSGTCTGKGETTVTNIDCSGMTLDKCPKTENLGKGPVVSMVATSPHSGKPAGCYGPCLKLIDDKWNNTMAVGRKRDDPGVVPYCCTFPPMTSEKCNAGPIGTTEYVKTVHQVCPGVYAFAYDDALGLMRCTYGQYKLTFFCPDGQAAPTLQRYEPWAGAKVAEDRRPRAAWPIAGLASVTAVAALGWFAWRRRSHGRAPMAESAPILEVGSAMEVEEAAAACSG